MSTCPPNAPPQDPPAGQGPPTVLPGKPGYNQATFITPTGEGFQLTWTQSDHAHVGFRIYRRTHKNGAIGKWLRQADLTDPVLVHPYGTDTIQVVDRCVEQNDEFDYYVAAYNYTQLTSTGDPVEVPGDIITTPGPWQPVPLGVVPAPPHIEVDYASPSIGYATNNLANTVEITWSPGIPPAGYQPLSFAVWRWMQISGTWQWVLAAQLQVGSSAWYDVGVASGQGYYYCVGENYNDNTSHYSDYIWGVAA